MCKVNAIFRFCNFSREYIVMERPLQFSQPGRRTPTIDTIKHWAYQVLASYTVLDLDRKLGYILRGRVPNVYDTHHGVMNPATESVEDMETFFFQELNKAKQWEHSSEDTKETKRQLVHIWLYYVIMTTYPDRFIEIYHDPALGSQIPPEIIHIFSTPYLDPRVKQNIPEQIRELLDPEWQRKKNFVMTMAETGYHPMSRYKAQNPELFALQQDYRSIQSPRERDAEANRLIRDAEVRSMTARQARVHETLRRTKTNEVATEPLISPAPPQEIGDLPPLPPESQPARDAVLGNSGLRRSIANFLGGKKSRRRRRTHKSKSSKKRSSTKSK